MTTLSLHTSLSLSGVFLYGLGHWDRVAADEHLKLREKLVSVVDGGAGPVGGAGGALPMTAEDKSILPKGEPDFTCHAVGLGCHLKIRIRIFGKQFCTSI